MRFAEFAGVAALAVAGSLFVGGSGCAEPAAESADATLCERYADKVLECFDTESPPERFVGNCEDAIYNAETQQDQTCVSQVEAYYECMATSSCTELEQDDPCPLIDC